MENFSAIELHGRDARDFGQRMFSRDLRDLAADHAKLSLFLSAEGKVSALFWIILTEVGLLLLTSRSRASALYELIERYHFSESFKTTIVGEKASSWKVGQSFADGEGRIEKNILIGSWRGTDFKIELDSKNVSNSQGDTKIWDAHRIQNLIPEFEKDYSESALVFDLGFENLCDQNKGCYIGQEVVERVRTHGGTGPKRLASLIFEKPPREEENLMDSAGKNIGQLTKSHAAFENHFLSLGYLKRGSDLKSDCSTLDSKISGKILKVI